MRPRRAVAAPASSPAAPASGEQEVDLNKLENTSSTRTPDARGATMTTGGSSNYAAVSNLLPNFKFYFDLWLINQPGVQDFTFRNIHNYVFVDVLPDNKLTFSFSFNLGGRANYYELDYQMTPRLQIRGGKILIPFDDTFPHTMYGGRPNLSEFLLDPTQPFLPDLWAELGVAAKYRLVDMRNFHLDAQFYVTEGFESGGTDPKTGGPYPNFAGDLNDLSLDSGKDNNRDKALGGRIETLWYRKFGLNASFYTCRWSDQATQSDRLTAYDIDSQLRFSSTGTEFRAGLMGMNVQVPGDQFTRGGWYGEASQKFGARRDYKGLLRFGGRQYDSRVIEENDSRLVGLAILWKPGLVQWSLESWRDFNTEFPNKRNFSLTALRAAIEL